MMSKRWEIATADEDALTSIQARTGLPRAIAGLLLLRGFDQADDIEEYLNPRLARLSDPYELPQMKMAAERIWKAIDGNESITVFGDYDVDGVTSASLLTRVLSALGANVQPFIPDRLDEGYGLSSDALERCLTEQGSSVVVTVDCGTNSVESIGLANDRGVDVIVTDHHEPEAQTAAAYALINPKLGTVPAHEILSGVGVAFKLAHALVKTGRTQKKAAASAIDLRDYLDIAALGTVADIVPLKGENRIIVHHGLAQLGKTKWVGLEALKKVAGVKGRLETYHLGFQLGPRINAAGRIGEPMKALELLVTDEASDAGNIAQLLDANNRERQQIERKMVEAAFTEIDAYFDPEKHFGLVVAREGWHPGVVGIVASRVSRHYNRPAIIMGIEEDGRARGSCRSIGVYNMLEGLQACADTLNTFGGHQMAAGLEVKPGDLELFKTGFNAAVASALSSADLTPVQHVDAFVAADELSWEFLEQLKKLRPFGQDNPEPVWALQGVQVSGSPRVVGGKHLKLAFAVDGKSFDAIAFNFPMENVPSGELDVAFTLKENFWNGTSSLQLQVQDIRKSNCTR